ncbi:hypothetical protein EJ04DRAFT_549804 [Polyplosphaeria fusca]|uniref:Knr4/Smi1-like domain-containing protein n=1 Tax=Polyplosphaeria fusca TaxID=682080 RepID=A0A9P4V7M1_9PLEO|nr:hypothetical protein EJ04DRAFT_549804 [Polyplosphaeria fusca]
MDQQQLEHGSFASTASNENASVSFSPMRIFQAPNDKLYSSVQVLALTFAVLGYVDVAARLVSAMNTYDYNHGQDAALRPLRFFWSMVDVWPAGEKERVKKAVVDGRKRRAKADSGEDLTDQDLDVAQVSEEEIKAEVEALAQCYQSGFFWPGYPRCSITNMQYMVRHRNGKEQVKEVDKSPRAGELSQSEMQDLIKEISACIDEAYPEFSKTPAAFVDLYTDSALVNMLDMRLILDEEGAVDIDESVPSARELLGIISKRLDSKVQIVELAKSQWAWSLLRQGALVDILGLDRSKIEAFAKEVEEAIHERFKSGRLSLEDLSVEKILHQLNHNTIVDPRSVSRYVETGDDLPETILRAPASEKDISDAEQRLDVSLPEDYKAFLRLTNGIEGPFGGILHAPPLHTLDSIQWISDDWKFYLEENLEIPNMEWACMYKYDEFHEWPKVEEALWIGDDHPGTDSVWLIPPSRTTAIKDRVRQLLAKEDLAQEAKSSLEKAVLDFAGSWEHFWGMEWACMAIVVFEAKSYVNFKAYLRGLAEDGEAKGEDIVLKRKFFGYHI